MDCALMYFIPLNERFIMFNKLLLVVSVSIFGLGLVYAEPAQNPHKQHDQKMQACKNEADQLQLGGDERRAYIAQCMKKEKLPQ